MILTVQDRLRIYTRIQIPKIHLRACIAEMPEYTYKAKITSYLEDLEKWIREGKGLLLYGPYSSGKSAIAAICLKFAVEKGFIGYWVRGMDLTTDKIEGNMFDAEVTVMERCLRVPILVIDEVILKRNVAYSEVLLEEIVRSRLDDKKCTILTTNHSLEELQERHPALTAALEEAVWKIEIKGYDFRKRCKAESESKPRTNKDGTTKMW